MQNGLQFPVEVLSGKHIPESALGMGRTFRTGPRRKARPGIGARNGMRFPDGALAETATRNSRSEWDVVSGWSLQRKLRPGIWLQTGVRFPNKAARGNCDPDSMPRTGRIFQQKPPAESASRKLLVVPVVGVALEGVDVQVLVIVLFLLGLRLRLGGAAEQLESLKRNGAEQGNDNGDKGNLDCLRKF